MIEPWLGRVSTFGDTVDTRSTQGTKRSCLSDFGNEKAAICRSRILLNGQATERPSRLATKRKTEHLAGGAAYAFVVRSTLNPAGLGIRVVVLGVLSGWFAKKIEGDSAIPSLDGFYSICHCHPFFQNATLWWLSVATPVVHAKPATPNRPRLFQSQAENRDDWSEKWPAAPDPQVARESRWQDFARGRV